MGQRLELQTLLEEVLGSPNVYFQPPPNVSMKYPAIVYSLDYIKLMHADNSPYKLDHRWSVTLIHRDPDNTIVHDLLLLPKCSFERHFKGDNLNHYVFQIYF